MRDRAKSDSASTPQDEGEGTSGRRPPRRAPPRSPPQKPERQPDEQSDRQPERIDRYELYERIGRGGTATVYRAIDTKLGRTVAIKTATSRMGAARLSDRVRQRFLREAKALSRVAHRNVVQVLDFGFADDGTPFLVMEHLSGRDLGTLLDETPSPLPVAQIADIVLGVCAALRACHRAGIIHRDLKPANVFLVETDTGPTVKVLDFGVSKTPAADDLTREGQILGTPQFLAPEQIDGKVGPASDQYALGVLLYVCLTRRLPFEEQPDRGLLRAIETGQFEPPSRVRPDLPEAIEAIVLRAMQISPGDRFESVHALGRELWALATPRAQEEWRGYFFPPLYGGIPQAVPLTRTEVLEETAGDEAATGETARLDVPTKSSRHRLSTAGGWFGRWETDADGETEETSRPRRAARIGMSMAALAIVGGTVALTAPWQRGRRDARPTSRPDPPRRSPPTAAPPPAVTVSPAPRTRPPAPPSPAPPAAAPPGERRDERPDERPRVEPPARDEPPRRAKSTAPARPHAPSGPPLPNIDQTGIGIPTD